MDKNPDHANHTNLKRFSKEELKNMLLPKSYEGKVIVPSESFKMIIAQILKSRTPKYNFNSSFFLSKGVCQW